MLYRPLKSAVALSSLLLAGLIFSSVVAQSVAVRPDILTLAAQAPLIEIERVLRRGVNLETRDAAGRTPLMIAISDNAHFGREVALGLIQRRVNVNARDNAGFSPLMLAVAADDPLLVEALVAAGASVTAINQAGQSSFHVAALSSRAEVIAVLAHALIQEPMRNQVGSQRNAQADVASDAPPEPRLAEIRIENRSDLLEVTDREGFTALLRASERGDPSVMAALLEAGSNPRAVTPDDETPLILIARDNPTPAAVRLLANAAPEVVDNTDRRGISALLYLIGVVSESEEGDMGDIAMRARLSGDAITILLDAGADVNAVGPNSTLPRDFAQQNPLLLGTDAYWRINDSTRRFATERSTVSAIVDPETNVAPIRMQVGRAQRFTLRIDGSSVPADWRVISGGGSIDFEDGLVARYRAPEEIATIVIEATSRLDGNAQQLSLQVVE